MNKIILLFTNLLITSTLFCMDSLECPGRKWISVSNDGGITWVKITDLRYDTGEQFYSPATFAESIPSTATGKLYGFLNIHAYPPVGSSPQYHQIY